MQKIITKLTSIAIILASTISFASAQSWMNVGVPVGGSINALSSFAGNLYMGGSFTRLNGNESDFTAIYNGSAVTAHVQAALTGTTGISTFYISAAPGSPTLFALGDQSTGTATTAPAYCTSWATGAGWAGEIYRTPAKARCMVSGTLIVTTLPVTTASAFFVGMSASGGLNYVARRNAANTAWIAAGSGFNAKVNCLEIYNGSLYAGGDFTTTGANVINHLAKWDAVGSKWVAVGAGCNGNVRTLKAYNGALYIGGDFARANNVTNTRLIAKYDGTTFTSLGGGITAGNSVRVIQSGNGTIYVGGDFTKAGTVATKNVVSVITASPYWTNYGSGATAPVNTITYHNSRLYMAQEAVGTAANYLKVWSATVATENETPYITEVAALPNPTSGELTVKTAEEMKSITIYSLSGVLVASETDIFSNNHTVSLANLPQGAYILQVTTVDGKNGVQKVVKY